MSQVLLKTDRDSVWSRIFFALYILLLVWNACHHEPWRDEAQAWLIARDRSLFEIFKYTSYEGTPPLWHLLLFPFAKLGFPYTTMFVMHSLIAVGIVAFWLKKAPFDRFIKYTFLFTYLITYEYAIIARSYSLSVFFIFLIAHFYSQRCQRSVVYGLFIGLLSWTNSHSFVLACAFFCEWVLSNWKQRNLQLSIIWTILSLVFLGAIFCIMPKADQLQLQSSQLRHYPLILNDAFWSTVGQAVPWLFSGLAVIMFALAVYGLRRHSKILFLFLLGWGVLSVLFMRNHFGSLRHHGLILIWTLAAYWIVFAIEKSDRFQDLFLKSLRLSFALSVLVSIGVTVLETRFAFSGGKAVAQFIHEQGWQDYKFLATRSTVSESILPYFKNLRFFYPELEKYGSYIHYNIQGWDPDIDQQELALALKKPSTPSFPYLILTFELTDQDLLKNYKLVYKSNPEDFVSYFGKQEKYFLYQPSNSS